MLEDNTLRILKELESIHFEFGLVRTNIVTFSNRLTELENRIIELGVELKFEIEKLK